MIELVAQIESTSDAGRRRDLADTVIAEIMRHAVAEEMHVYPAIEGHLPDDPEEVENDKQEHQVIVELMKQVERADAASPSSMDLIWRIEAQLRDHIEDEEADLFPRLADPCPEQNARRDGPEGRDGQEAGPGPPPPQRAPPRALSQDRRPGVGMVDRLLDKLTGRQTG